MVRADIHTATNLGFLLRCGRRLGADCVEKVSFGRIPKKFFATTASFLSSFVMRRQAAVVIGQRCKDITLIRGSVSNTSFRDTCQFRFQSLEALYLFSDIGQLVFGNISRDRARTIRFFAERNQG